MGPVHGLIQVRQSRRKAGSHRVIFEGCGGIILSGAGQIQSQTCRPYPSKAFAVVRGTRRGERRRWESVVDDVELEEPRGIGGHHVQQANGANTPSFAPPQSKKSPRLAPFPICSLLHCLLLILLYLQNGRSTPYRVSPLTLHDRHSDCSAL